MQQKDGCRGDTYKNTQKIMKKYSEVAPLVKNSLKKLSIETERSFAIKDIENEMSKHNVSSFSDLPLNVKAKMLNGK